MGVDLGGARGKTTAVARIEVTDADRDQASVLEVCTRSSPAGADESPWHDAALVDYLTDETQASPDQDTYASALSDDLDRALGTLSDRERSILSMYFGLDGAEPMTLEDIGKRLKLTRERIRQIKEKAIQRLRHSTRARFLQGYMES